MSRYKRGEIWWICYQGPHSVVRESTGQRDGRVAERIERQRRAEVARGTWKPRERRPDGVTVADYAERWVARQWERKLKTARDIDARIRHHVVPRIGSRLMTELRPVHMIDLVRELRSTELAPRTVNHVWTDVKAMFRDAVIDEIVLATPCVIPPGTLPPKKDADPRWRARAVFTRDELERLISDERIAPDRRVFYALEFLTGCRFGEVAGRRWRDWDPEMRPLGRLVVDSQYDDQPLKSPTGDAPSRSVPVHPTLAAILAEWRLDGFPRFFGRAPEPEDFLVPTRHGATKGRPRDDSTMWRHMQLDLSRLGLRPRRQHDARRTFVSLARGDGARRDVLQAITHGDAGDVFDDYTSWPWETLCEAVLCLRVKRRGSATVHAIGAQKGSQRSRNAQR